MEDLEIVISLNKNFLPSLKPFFYTLDSTLNRAAFDKIIINYLYLSTDSKDVLQEVEHYCKRYNFTFNSLEISENMWKDFLRSTKDCIPYEKGYERINTSQETLYRLLIPFIFNKKKCLYIDTDVLFNKDISEFYLQDFEGKLAVVSENLIGDKECKAYSYSESLKKTYNFSTYFNAGVMLLNVEKIRTLYPYEKFLKFLKEVPCKVTYLDQDLLNILFKNDVKVCNSFEYNYCWDEKRDLFEKAVIVHYRGQPKNWNIPISNYTKLREPMYLRAIEINTKLIFVED